MTYTYTKCNIVINQVRGGPTNVYVEDFSYNTDVPLLYWTRNTLNPKHVRKFNSMKEFTKFLLEESCIVEKCIITIDDEM